MEKVTTLGIDLAKRVFALYGADAAGRRALRKTVRLRQLMEVMASLPQCLVGMEVCSEPTGHKPNQSPASKDVIGKGCTMAVSWCLPGASFAAVQITRSTSWNAKPSRY